MAKYFSDDDLFKIQTEKTIRSLEFFFQNPKEFLSAKPPKHISGGFDIPGIDNYFDAINRQRAGATLDFFYADELPPDEKKYLTPGAEAFPIYAGIIDGKPSFRYAYWADALLSEKKSFFVEWLKTLPKDDPESARLPSPPRLSPEGIGIQDDFFSLMGKMKASIETLTQKVDGQKELIEKQNIEIEALKSSVLDSGKLKKTSGIMEIGRSIAASVASLSLTANELYESVKMPLWITYGAVRAASVMVGGAFVLNHDPQMSHHIASILQLFHSEHISPPHVITDNVPASVPIHHLPAVNTENDSGGVPDSETPQEYSSRPTSPEFSNLSKEHHHLLPERLTQHGVHIDHSEPADTVEYSPLTDDRFTEYREKMEATGQVSESFIKNVSHNLFLSDPDGDTMIQSIDHYVGNHPERVVDWPAVGDHKATFLGDIPILNSTPYHVMQEGHKIYFLSDDHLGIDGNSMPIGSEVSFHRGEKYDFDIIKVSDLRADSLQAKSRFRP